MIEHEIGGGQCPFETIKSFVWSQIGVDVVAELLWLEVNHSGTGTSKSRAEQIRAEQKQKRAQSKVPSLVIDNP